MKLSTQQGPGLCQGCRITGHHTTICSTRTRDIEEDWWRIFYVGRQRVWQQLGRHTAEGENIPQFYKDKESRDDNGYADDTDVGRLSITQQSNVWWRDIIQQSLSTSTWDVASMSNMQRILMWDKSAISLVWILSTTQYQHFNCRVFWGTSTFQQSVTFNEELLRPDTYCIVLGRSDEWSMGCATIQCHQIGLTIIDCMQLLNVDWSKCAQWNCLLAFGRCTSWCTIYPINHIVVHNTQRAPYLYTG